MHVKVQVSAFLCVMQHSRFQSGVAESSILLGCDAVTVFVLHCLTLKTKALLSFDVGRDSSVGIETRYGLDGPGIECRWRRDFPHPPRPDLGPTQPPVQCVPGLTQG